MQGIRQKISSAVIPKAAGVLKPAFAGFFIGVHMLDSVMTLSVMDIVSLVVAGAFGLAWHYLAKIIELRKLDHGITLASYYLEHKPETLVSVMTVLAGIVGLIELGQATIFNVTLLAYTVDSHANKFRSRGQGLIR